MPFASLPTFDGYTVAYLLDRAWALRARCDACGHSRIWYARDLTAFPAPATLAQIAEKLACKACGGTAGELDVVNDTGAQSVRQQEAYEAKLRGEKG